MPPTSTRPSTAARTRKGEKLNEFHREARDLIHAVYPEGSYSAEHVSDVNVSVIDYTWEWFNAADIEGAAPFRYVFPQFRLNANVNEHPRGALTAFMEGALINVMPGNMHSYFLRDCPELSTVLRQLHPLWQRFLPFFTEGQYRYLEGLTVAGGSARLFTHGDDILVIATNPSDEPADISVELDPAIWGASVKRGTLTVLGLDGQEIERAEGVDSAFRRQVRLAPDSLAIFAFTGEQ